MIGTGNIGRTVLRHLSGFGCKLLAYDLYPNDEARQYAEYVDLDTLYKSCDIITLHTNATAANRHMIDANAIAKMKSGVVLINTARGRNGRCACQAPWLSAAGYGHSQCCGRAGI